MKVSKPISPVYFDFMLDWKNKYYLCVGGYGSGKSYHIALKIILKCFEEKRKVLVVREVFGTHYESTFDLFKEILEDMELYTTDINYFKRYGHRATKALIQKSPLTIHFPNGSRIIFKGMDNPEKIKSINGVSIVWVEECSEVKYAGFKELQGRLRTPDKKVHYILSCNPVGKDNWVYRHFFKRLDENGKETIILDDEILYSKKQLEQNSVFYLHTTPDDNTFLNADYIHTLEQLQLYDPHLYEVARKGRFAPAGKLVLPQIIIAKNPKLFKVAVNKCGDENKYFGFDFGFEESYNAVVSMAVDLENSVLYIYDEIYINHITDDEMCMLPQMEKLRTSMFYLNARGYNKQIVADNADPKAIKYYRQQGFSIRACANKFAGSRLSNTRKIKRFRHIVISPKCKNTIRELQNLTYKKDRNGNTIYDEFNIDPHTFSAIWYALDKVTVADVKDKKYYSKSGTNKEVI